MTDFALNKSNIMTEAWGCARDDLARNPTLNVRALFAQYLRRSWFLAKAAVKAAAEEAEIAERSIEGLEAEILYLENADYQGHDGRMRLETLRAALKRARCEEKRRVITAAEFCAVTFTKRDGTQRVIRIDGHTPHRTGDTATPSGKRAVQMRKATHPFLMPVWDADADAFRSVNLETVSRIETDETVHKYAR